MKIKKYIIIFLEILIIILLVSEKQGSSTPKEIFYKNVRSVVEVMAVTADGVESYGTAVFVNENGTLITNAHIVTFEKEEKLTEQGETYIRFADSEEYLPVAVISIDGENDLALLNCDCLDGNSQACEFSKNGNIDYGDTVYAIGNSMNNGLAISQGIISSPKVNIESDGYVRECIQADLNISYGNSGGALLDKNGLLVGITSFRIKDSDGGVVHGMSYSVPMNVIIPFLQENGIV